MTLADERRSRKVRELDPLEFRVFLFIVGGAFLALAAVVLRDEQPDVSPWIFGVIGLFAFLGCCMLFISVFGSGRLVDKWSDAAGTHEASIVVFLIALPIAWVIRKVIRGNAT